MERLHRILAVPTRNGNSSQHRRCYRIFSAKPQRTILPKTPNPTYFHLDPMDPDRTANHHPVQRRCGSTLHLLPVLMQQLPISTVTSPIRSITVPLKWAFGLLLCLYAQVLGAQQTSQPQAIQSQALTDNSHEDSSVICLTCNELRESPKLKKACLKTY